MKSDYVLSLVRSHYDRDEERFRGIALSIAANLVARSPRMAEQFRRLADRPRIVDNTFVLLPAQRELFRARPVPTTRLGDMVLDPVTTNLLLEILAQQRTRESLHEKGLEPDRKFLFVGPPGVGKTMAASAIAGELGMNLVRVELHGIISQFLGQTAAKLAQVFEVIATRPAVYLFDEFDALASARQTNNRETDVGEMRRAVNTLLQMIEDDHGASIIIATTNLEETIDKAIFRRLDEVVSFTLPTGDDALKVVRSRMLWPEGADRQIDWSEISHYGEHLSHADLVSATDRAHKHAVLRGNSCVTTSDLVFEIKRRRMMTEDRTRA